MSNEIKSNIPLGETSVTTTQRLPLIDLCNFTSKYSVGMYVSASIVLTRNGRLFKYNAIVCTSSMLTPAKHRKQQLVNQLVSFTCK